MADKEEDHFNARATDNVKYCREVKEDKERKDLPIWKSLEVTFI